MVKNQGEAGLYRWHSLDHLVGAREQCRWNFEAKHPGDLEVHSQLHGPPDRPMAFGAARPAILLSTTGRVAAAISAPRRSCAHRRRATCCSWSAIGTPSTLRSMTSSIQFHPRHRAGRERHPKRQCHGGNPSVPATTVPEFIAYAKTTPGKINYARLEPEHLPMWLGMAALMREHNCGTQTTVHTFIGWRGTGGGERRHRPMRHPAVTADRIDYWIPPRRRSVSPSKQRESRSR
jgi:hypothetical protein